METELYACFNQNSEQRSWSSSGGVYPLIAAKVIEKGGVVYAAVYDEQLYVIHRRIDKYENIAESCGSKYVASQLGTAFLDIYKDIRSGIYCLFVGTPCQCAGLRSFIEVSSGAEKDDLFDRLFILDFVCHGVPGRTAWHSYLDHVRKKIFNVKTVNMRDKTSGWSRQAYSFSMADSLGNITVDNWGANPYLVGFISNLYLRPSCSNCHFKGISRNTDVTLADFWGVWDLYPDMDDNKGTSLVMVHSLKGKKMFTDIADSMTVKTITLDKIKDYNSSIYESSPPNPKRQIFYEKIEKGIDFKKVVDDLTGKSLNKRIFKKIKLLFGK